MPRKSLRSRSVLRLLALTLINILSFTGIAHLTPPVAASALLHATPHHRPESIHAKNPAPSQTNQAAQTRLSEAYGKLPLQFETNQGQADAQVKFISRGQGYSLFLTATEAVLALRKAGGERTKNKAKPSSSVASVVRMKLVAANPHSQVSGREPQAGRINYFTGNDARRWRADVPTFARVQYDDVYPGIDLVYYGNQRQLEYDFRLAPGANPNNIRLTFDGANKLEIDRATGDLILHVTEGQVRQHKPVIYQEVNGVKHHVAGHYVLANNQQVSFQIDDYDTTKPLVIDPVVSYATFLGGSAEDFGNSIAVDDAGNAYVTGYTYSTNFPVVGAAQSNPGGTNSFYDAFVTKLNAEGSALIYSTYFGGDRDDIANSIAVDSIGNAYLTGQSQSSNFPTTANAFRRTSTMPDAFVTKLDANGALAYSTLLGSSGNGSDGRGIAIDRAGNAYVTGGTGGITTTPGAFQTASTSGETAFVTKLNPDGSALVYSTYLGGRTTDFGRGIAVDSAGNASVTGTTFSTNFPTMNAFQSAHANGGNGSDAFVTRLNNTGSGLIFSTYLGGGSDDAGTGIAVDTSDNAYVTGYTFSNNFPTVRALDNANGGGFDAFVAKFSFSGSPDYVTYLGGSGDDVGSGIAVDGFRNAYVTGWTSSINFPTADAVQPRAGHADASCAGVCTDAFVTKLNDGGSSLVHSTYLGGNGNENYFGGGFSFRQIFGGIAVNNTGDDVYITGSTSSATTFPTTTPYQPTFGGITDAFVVKLDEVALSGRITELNGNGIAGVTITVTVDRENEPDTAITTETDANGNYRIIDVPGGCSIFVVPSRDGYTFNPPITGGVSSRCDVVFRNEVINFFGGTQAYTISGRVIDAAGNGVSGAQLTLTATRQAFTRQLFTDGSGNFFDGGLLAGDNYMLTLADSFTPSGERRFFSPPSRTFNNLSSNQSVVFEENVRIIGRLTTDGGAALTGGQITYSYTVQRDGFTGGAGSGTANLVFGNTYSVSLPAGSTGIISASQAGYSFNPPGLRFENLRANTTVNFTGTPATTYNIVGRVLDGQGNGIAFLPITLNGSQLREVRTDSNGRYTFANVPAIGTYTVRPAQPLSFGRPTVIYSFKLNTRTFTNLSGNQNADFVAAPFRSPRFSRTRK